MNAIVMLHFIHNESAFQRPQTVNRSQHIENKLLVIFHTRSMDLQKIIITSGYVVTFCYLGNILYYPRKLGCDIPVKPAQFYTAKTTKP